MPFKKFFNKNFVAQGTIEYLVIVAVVVVVSLVVVGLLISQTDSVTNISSSASSIKNKIGVDGISIVESVASYDGNGYIVLKNVGPENLTVDRIVVDGVNHNYSESILTGSQMGFKLQDIDVCVGAKKSYSVKIYYVNSNFLNKSADFETITIDCSVVFSPIGTFVEETVNSEEDVYLFLEEDCYDSEQNPIPICTLSDLNRMRENLIADFELQADINATPTREWNSGEGWEPIGNLDNYNEEEYFNGKIDGNNKKILNLYINRPLSDNVGLLEVNWVDGNISSIGLVDSNITGKNIVGGIIGDNFGVVLNVYNTGDIRGNMHVGGLVGMNDGQEITNAYNIGNITGNRGLGGLIGYNNGVVTNVYNSGNVIGTSNLGGIAGFAEWSPITNAYNTGNIIGDSSLGGIIGQSMETIVTKVYSLGNISGNDYLGGIVGTCDDIENPYSCPTITSSYWDTYLTGQGNCNYDNNTGCIATNNELSRYYSQIPTTLNWPNIWIITENNLPALNLE